MSKRRNDRTHPEPATIGVPEAAVQLGISRNAAYAAAKRGQIPAIRLGRILRVPTALLNRLLRGDAA